MDLGVPNGWRDNRRLEVVANGLPLFGGVQLAIETTLVSALQVDGELTREAVDKGWCGSHARSPTQGANVPRTCPARGPSQVSRLWT